MSVVQTDHIELRETRSGEMKPFIKGTRIAVQDIYVSHELMGRTPDEILLAHPHLTLAQVHAALAYSFDHVETIRRQLQQDREFTESLRREIGPGPLSEKLNPTENGDDSLSSG